MSEEFGDSFIWIESVYNTKRCKYCGNKILREDLTPIGKNFGFDEADQDIDDKLPHMLYCGRCRRPLGIWQELPRSELELMKRTPEEVTGGNIHERMKELQKVKEDAERRSEEARKQIREVNDLKRELAETKSQLDASRNRCKNLEERLSKQTLEYYAKFDEQAVEIARLQHIIEQNIEGGYHERAKHDAGEPGGD